MTEALLHWTDVCAVEDILPNTGVCALVGGMLLYGVLRRLFDLARRERVPLLHRLNGAQAYETTMLQPSPCCWRTMAGIW